MKIVIIGGTGLIGAKLARNLRERGHEVLAAAPSSGVNSITREGLAQAMDGAEVVVDVANAPSWEDNAVLEFFETSSRNLLAAEAAAGVRHHVALSIVGSERLPECGYFRAKVAQENLIKSSQVPYTILRAAVLRVRRRHRRVGRQRRGNPPVAGAVPADRLGRRGGRARRRRARSASQRHA